MARASWNLTHAGGGNRFWGPMTVTSIEADSGAYLAYEDFAEDAIVDIKPYIPRSVYANYGFTKFDTKADTTDFVLDKSTSTPSLVYRHKPGATYPVTCRIAPYSNLEWKDYEFTGKIIKPAGAVYDSIGVGVIFYAESKDRYYSLKARGLGKGGNGFVVMSHWVDAFGNAKDSILDSLESAPLFQGTIDTIRFAAKIVTNNVMGPPYIADGETRVQVVAWANGTKPPYPSALIDRAANRKPKGYGGVWISSENGTAKQLNTNLLKIEDVKIERVDHNESE